MTWTAIISVLALYAISAWPLIQAMLVAINVMKVMTQEETASTPSGIEMH